MGKDRKKASGSHEPQEKSWGLSQNRSPSGTTRQTPRVGQLCMMSLRLFSILLAAVVSGARGWGYCECWSQRQVGFIWCRSLELAGRVLHRIAAGWSPVLPVRTGSFPASLPSAPQCSSEAAAARARCRRLGLVSDLRNQSAQGIWSC